MYIYTQPQTSEPNEPSNDLSGVKYPTQAHLVVTGSRQRVTAI